MGASERSTRLDSWKEIADHVGRDVRTAIRWEADRGLPVHRVPGGKRGSVFAFTDEIDRWLLEAADRPNGGNVATARTLRPPEHGGRAAVAYPTSWRRGWASVLVAGLVLVLVGLVIRADVGGRRPGVPVAGIALAGTGLVALGPAREVLWRHDFGRAVANSGGPDGDQKRVSFSAADGLDGDGQPDLVVSVPFSYGQARPDAFAWDELFAFSASGRVLWSERLDLTLTFGGGTFVPPWRTTGGPGAQIAVFEVDGQKRIAWAQCHHTWWPSVLTVLDASGHPLSRWVHSGNILTVAAAVGAAEPRLLVGGVSNSRAAGFFAVLDARHVEGAGPEEPGSPFECPSCSSRRPLRYFTIQPSELALASDPYNYVVDLRTDAAGVEVRTDEGHPAGSCRVAGVVRFSHDFALEHAAWSSGWERCHRELERAGKLDHSVERCPERDRPPHVREWTQEGGWRDLTPPIPVVSRR